MPKDSNINVQYEPVILDPYERSLTFIPDSNGEYHTPEQVDIRSTKPDRLGLPALGPGPRVGGSTEHRESELRACEQAVWPRGGDGNLVGFMGTCAILWFVVCGQGGGCHRFSDFDVVG